MAEWLEQASQWHGVSCHDLEVMSSNPGQVELGVRSTSVLGRICIKNIIEGNLSSFDFQNYNTILVEEMANLDNSNGW